MHDHAVSINPGPDCHIWHRLVCKLHQYLGLEEFMMIAVHIWSRTYAVGVLMSH